MTIGYEVSEYTKEHKKIEIQDTKNVFLQGTNPYDGLPTYFGIWNNKGTLVIVTIISWRTINYQRWLSLNGYTESDIKEYIKNNKNVKTITKEEFKEQIQNIRQILEI